MTTQAALRVLVAVLLVTASIRPAAQQQPPAPVFRTNLAMVSVDVIVRDRDGRIVRGLTEKDFELVEDGRPQEVRTFTFAEIKESPSTVVSVDLLAGLEEKVLAATSGAAAPVAPSAPVPMRSEDLAGRRLMVLLFDTSSMEPEDVQRSVDSARDYVAKQMSASDLVAVATVSTMLNVLTDFTADRAKVSAALIELSYSEGTETPPPSAQTAATDAWAQAVRDGAMVRPERCPAADVDDRGRERRTAQHPLTGLRCLRVPQPQLRRVRDVGLR